MTTFLRTRAQDDLTLALLQLALDGGRPRCGDPVTGAFWVSDDPAERAVAAQWCAGCPVISACAAAADSVGEQHYVWAGIDRGKAVS